MFQSQKFDGQSGVQCGSHVAKSWSVFIDQTDKMSKLVKEMAESLATTTLEKLNNLYLEKKTNRKQHQEEYARNQAELNRLQESVHRLRNDYERCIDGHVVAKAKYEDQYTKVGHRFLFEIFVTISRKFDQDAKSSRISLKMQF